jgi:hypothetical protein
MVLSNFIGCLAEDTTGDIYKGQICTDMGSPYMIKISITSPIPLPQNLGFALNGKTVSLDECNPGAEFPLGRIEIIRGRTKAIINFEINSENFAIYFPKGFKKPASNLMNLTIYDREKCTDPLSQFQEVSDVRISWKPVYINGEHCGVSSYYGESQIDL